MALALQLLGAVALIVGMFMLLGDAWAVLTLAAVSTVWGVALERSEPRRPREGG